MSLRNFESRLKQMHKKKKKKKRQQPKRRGRDNSSGILRAFDFSGAVCFASRIAASMNRISTVHRTLNVIRWEVHASVVPNASASMCDDTYCTCVAVCVRDDTHGPERIRESIVGTVRASHIHRESAFYIFSVRLCVYTFCLRSAV